MTFRSILFDGAEGDAARENRAQPEFFADLNLDQVVESLTAGKQDYDLRPFFYTPVRDIGTIKYRHEIMQDLEDEALLGMIVAFAQDMIVMRRYLALVEKLDFKRHKEGWYLEAALVYCRAVAGLAEGLNRVELRSRGLSAFRAYLARYARSDAFVALAEEARQLKADLGTIEYDVTIKTGTVKVRRYEGEEDYSVDVLRTFERFKQGAVKDYTLKLNFGGGMNHVEAQILDCVAKLYPDVFSRLAGFASRRTEFPDPAIHRFDREIQFYVAYVQFMARLKAAGLRFCYPEITTAKEVYAYDAFDVALAGRFVSVNKPVVVNDFALEGSERVFVVSGPNQGGKTTFARMFGQLHYLAGLGCPVPGREARLFLFDRLFTHFEKEEDIRNLRGKLQDDLVRINHVLERCTPDSILIMNEIFSSTTLQDAVFLSKRIMERIAELDLLCVWVTFVDEIASFSEKTVSIVSTVVPENPAERTFRILRKPADGLAYALSIAEKHHVAYDNIMERIPA